MFAVIRTGGKQYRVVQDETIQVMRLAGEPGDVISFDDILFLSSENATEFTVPAGAAVKGEIVAQTRGPKVIAFKKRRRQNSKRKRGHRQDLTMVKITSVSM